LASAPDLDRATVLLDEHPLCPAGFLQPTQRRYRLSAGQHRLQHQLRDGDPAGPLHG
jgi:hypothetical protein